LSDQPIESPWLKLTTEGAQYAKRGGRFLTREVNAGRLRAARIGGRGELFARREWIDEWMEASARPVMVARKSGYR
jgi:hypothetical protein